MMNRFRPNREGRIQDREENNRIARSMTPSPMRPVISAETVTGKHPRFLGDVFLRREMIS
ncbi:uncharacterized protein EI90DRAFT_2041681 [Cantharellus anzutake]|uniref:uncharacterized protein n=1 Tax=Cantharellus anzutake TaxID=1750568 RepID=UPI0019081685|nr:uncharacterized protein EI90DRAFT_2041681 [Cantharellus anzutake]KAF8340267.1 hypothetical protein EI90DRAFT_2041681 [Cantharellus anzutake]